MIPTLGEYPEILVANAIELLALRLVGDAFELHRPLVAVAGAANHKGRAPIDPQRLDLARALDGVEHDLECVGHGDADHRRLRRTADRDARLDGVPHGAHEL